MPARAAVEPRIPMKPGVTCSPTFNPRFMKSWSIIPAFRVKVSHQQVELGIPITLNFTLQIGSTSTVVEVQATAAAELQTLNATIGSTIRNDQLQLLPNLGRDASSLSVLQVGVSLAGNVAGAATDQNSFQLDGGQNSDDMAGGNNEPPSRRN